MDRGRRNFTGGLAATSLAAGFALAAGAQPTPRFVRRNAHATGAGTAPLAAYARAVAAMQRRPASDPTSWAFQANIHGVQGPAPPTDPNDPRSIWDSCQHGNWHFLSWHRVYLYYFERIVRAASGSADFALPYWNYEPVANRALPAAFRRPTTNNPLFVAARNDGTDPDPRLQVNINRGDPVPASVVSANTALAARRFGSATSNPPGFTNLLEGQPHNILHVVVGGNGLMSDPTTAAQDPIFWLHHANIDRLWSRWLRQAPHTAPIDPAWANHPWTFFDETGRKVQMTGAQVIQTASQLNYRYDDEPAAPAVLPPPPSTEATEAAPTPVASAEGIITLDRQRPVAATLRAGPSESGRIVAAEGAQTPTYLVLEAVQYEGRQSTWYEVYVNAPEGAALSATSPYFAGNLGLFGLSGHHGEGGRVVFEVGDVLRAQRRAGLWSGDEISVRFMPRGPRSTTEAATLPPRIGAVRVLQ